MNGKKVNLAFLVTILLYTILVFAAGFLFPKLFSNIIINNLACEAVVLLPGLCFVLFSRENIPAFVGFHKIKAGTVLTILPFTLCCMPLITLLNLATQFWVENTAASAMESYQVAEMPFGLVLFSTGIFAPFCEELTCRGIYYRGYRKSGTAFGAMVLSSLLFALIHMNLNQAVYAFAVGILAVLLVEAAGSLWACVLFHGLINSSQIILMYSMLKVNPSVYSEAAALQAEMGDMLVYSVAAYLVLTAITLPVAWALLVFISSREGRRGALSALLPVRRTNGRQGNPSDAAPAEGQKLVSVPLLLGILLCLLLMAGELWMEPLLRLLTG